MRTCKVCALTLYVTNNGFASFDANVSREVYDVTFKRGQSFEQPDVTPADVSSGVWVRVLPPQASPYAPPDIARQTISSFDIDDPLAAQLAGFTYRRGSFGAATFYGANGYTESRLVYAELQNRGVEWLTDFARPCPVTVTHSARN